MSSDLTWTPLLWGLALRLDLTWDFKAIWVKKSQSTSWFKEQCNFKCTIITGLLKPTALFTVMRHWTELTFVTDWAVSGNWDWYLIMGGMGSTDTWTQLEPEMRESVIETWLLVHTTSVWVLISPSRCFPPLEHSQVSQHNTLWAGFEPARGNPIGFRVQRLNHSAIAALGRWRG